MKCTIILLTFFLFSNSAFNQAKYENLKPGDILSINKDSNTPFHHLYFQKSNFIIKRGAIANYKALDDMKVKIEEISQESIVKLTPLNGNKFFNVFSYVRANLQKALESNELEPVSINNKS